MRNPQLFGMKLSLYLYVATTVVIAACGSVQQTAVQQNMSPEPFRPQLHFSPQRAWMNDPNGMVYFNKTYHLFYQYYPDSTVWGPMHWGHATSADLVHWQHQPIALYPDSLGYIFSGSAVVDVQNTTGFGREGKTPLVAVFTQHNPQGEKQGRLDFQNQSLAFSLDEGKTWAKYQGSPVLSNPGIRDFRDPKVLWYADANKWIMTLATQDRVTFYSSPDLKNWKKESEFGHLAGAHGGVWECPDLFSFTHNGEKVWVLLVSINPGGPNGGSATQYFTGRFNGTVFTPVDTATRWIDYGPDDYAGVTWSNTGERKVFMGWMSNWQYAQVVPTKTWRSAMTVPRELSLVKQGETFLVASNPINELQTVTEKPVSLAGTMEGTFSGPAKLQVSATEPTDVTITLSNKAGQRVTLGYEKATGNYFIDRTASGHTTFEKGFAARHVAPRLSIQKEMSLTLLIDQSSVELFADNGLTVMTSIFFPDDGFSNVSVESPEKKNLTVVQLSPMKPVINQPPAARQ